MQQLRCTCILLRLVWFHTSQVDGQNQGPMRSEVQDLVRSGLRPRTDLRRVRGSESGLLCQAEGSLCRQEGVQCSGPNLLPSSCTSMCTNLCTGL